MNPQFEALEFHTIIEKLKECALSEQARSRFDILTPYLEEDICIRRMQETTAARRILDACGTPPLSSMRGLEALLTESEAGTMLLPAQLMEVVQFAAACKRLKAYLKRGEAIDAAVASYGFGIDNLDELRSEIERCVNEERVYDEASSELRSIRRKKEAAEGQIHEKLTQMLRSRGKYLADGYIANKNGHYVLPVQKRYQSQFSGTVIEVSGKGSTVFMEPDSIAKLQSDLLRLNVEEEGEVHRILYTLTALTADHASVLRRNIEAMEALDFLFAKAKLSASMKASAVEIGSERRLIIRQGRHPLLNQESCVPLDFHMEPDANGVIITGPNTGGKTVAIKTVGLLSLMAQCGLHIPCGANSYIAMQDGFWCDIGDSQNISQNLSTFSGHITNVIHILENASPDSLVLLDELGSGTDPAEGMGIAVAVLEELLRRGCMFMATTHYAQVKNYAEQTEGVRSARMAFDRESLRPLFRLELDRSGESCALDIAKRLGLAPCLLNRAYHEVYGEQEAFGAAGQALMRIPKTRLVRAVPQSRKADLSKKFSMGDSVIVQPGQEIGIVYRPADQNGDVIVQIKGIKQAVKHNRLKLKVPAEELYPPDYDFSIIFDTVEERKARKIMGKRYDPTISITYGKEL